MVVVHVLNIAHLIVCIRKGDIMEKFKKLIQISKEIPTLLFFGGIASLLAYIFTNVQFIVDILPKLLGNPVATFLVLYSFIVISYAFGYYLFYRLNVENIVPYLQNFENEVNKWKFKNFVKDINECIIPSEISGEYIVYGVNFWRTSNDEEERNKLIKIIKNVRVKKITFVCVHESGGFIEENVKDFLKYVDSETFIKMIRPLKKEDKKEEQRMCLYTRKTYAAHNAIITIANDKFLLYQMRYNTTQDKDFNSYINKLALKIENKETINKIKGDIRKSIGSLQPINIKLYWDEVQRLK